MKGTPQMNLVQNIRQTLAQNVQCPQNYQVMQNPQPAQTLLNAPDRYMEQGHLQEEEWKKRLEELNEKYGLDFFSDSELDSKSYKGKDYRYEHNYETLIW